MKSFETTEAKLNEVRMGINLVDGQEYKSTLAAISTVTAEILCKTLGPYASTTTIDDGVYTYPTKDGWAVCNRLRFGDAIQNTLFKFIRDISFRLNSKVGDGTTTATVLAQAIIGVGLKNVFTLIELLGVLIILAVIGLITLPIVSIAYSDRLTLSTSLMKLRMKLLRNLHLLTDVSL